MRFKRNGSELIELFAIKAGINLTQAKSFIQALSETVTEVAISEGKATISGFGRFTISEVADREGTQPGTGESIIIPAHKRMYFTPYKRLADVVNKKNIQIKNTELNTVTNTQMEKNNNSFSENLDEVDSQEKAALLDELELIILQKKKHMMSASIDIRVEDEYSAEQKEQNQREENGKKLPKEITSQDNITTIDPSHQQITKESTFTNIESTSSPKKYIPVDEDILKDFIQTMDELKTAIKNIDSKSDREKSKSNDTITINKKIFISSSLIGVFLLLVSSFLIGTTVNQFFSAGSTDNVNNLSQQSIQTNSTTTIQGQPIQAKGIERTELATKEAQRTNYSNANFTDKSKNMTNPSAASPASSGFSTTRSVRFNSETGLYNMAKEIYGNPRLWVLLFEENFNTNQNPDDIEDGTPLTIPVIATPSSLNRLEKERLRIALLHVAQAYENAGKRDLAQNYRSATVYYLNTM
tara:strand:+ start:32518 stop:33927 length:1410 start_codon:yes stop_codon:yes gene_type:complete